MNFLSQSSMGIFQEKRVIVRVDFNIPIHDNQISLDDAYRIAAVEPTINWLLGAGAKVIIISHIGRSGDSLQIVAQYIQQQFPHWHLEFCNDITGNTAKETITTMQSGSCVLLENIRTDEREESNDQVFAKELAGLGDFYVNDAFGVCHRNHASVIGIPKHLPSFAGFLIEAELHQLEHALNPVHPALIIMAGIKFETKLRLIEKLLPTYDYVLLGGGLLNTYLAQLGYGIGKSVYDEHTSLESLLENKKILLPEQVVIERSGESLQVSITDVTPDDVIVDVVISEKIKEVIENMETVVWNGPLGWYEKGYVQSVRDIVSLLESGDQKSIAGGGDIVSLLRQEKLDHAITFLSTGGGAMLEYLEQGTLPGFEAL
jgi:phosphoglycerate kinase